MGEMVTILETRSLTFGFGGNRIIDQLSLAVQQGEFLSIIGPNGAGKTTFFNLISGLYRPRSGSIHYQGKDVTAFSPAARAQAGLARSFQISAIFPTLSVHEHVRLAAQSHGPGRYQLLRPYTAYRRFLDRAAQILDLVGLQAHAQTPAGALSHGDKRKLELAMVIALEPEVLLLDEPTSGVSAEDVPGMAALIRRVREVERKTVIMIEHKIGMVLDLSDRVAVLAQGQLLALDTPAAVQRSEAVQAAYLGKGNS